MLLLFGVAGVAGNALGGYDADRWGYWRSLATIYTTLTLPLFAFSLPTPVAGSPLAAAGNGMALVARACPGGSNARSSSTF